jgi:hypothetical protein
MLYIEGIEKTNGTEILSWKLETINKSVSLTYDWLLRSPNYPHCYMFIVLDRVKNDNGTYRLDGVGFYSDPQKKNSVKEYKAPYTIDLDSRDMKHLPRFIHKVKPIISDIEARLWSDGKWMAG